MSRFGPRRAPTACQRDTGRVDGARAAARACRARRRCDAVVIAREPPARLARRPSLQHRANLKWDGLFCSNGPGDPSQCKETIKSLQWAISQDIPIFGICLGNQLLALAAGAKTYKMKYGNRGMNQPCVDLRTTRCYITSQNHGYAVDDQSLPEGWKALFVNANDRAESARSFAFTKRAFQPSGSDWSSTA